MMQTSSPRHTDASLLLRTDHPMSMGAFAHMMGLPMSWEALGSLPATLQHGRAGVYDLDPDGLSDFLGTQQKQTEEAAPGVMGALNSMLDSNRDGSVTDDVGRMLGDLFKQR